MTRPITHDLRQALTHYALHTTPLRPHETLRFFASSLRTLDEVRQNAAPDDLSSATLRQRLTTQRDDLYALLRDTRATRAELDHLILTLKAGRIESESAHNPHNDLIGTLGAARLNPGLTAPARWAALNEFYVNVSPPYALRPAERYAMAVPFDDLHANPGFHAQHPGHPCAQPVRAGQFPTTNFRAALLLEWLTQYASTLPA
ncbi:hypothetical protein [Deinococcus soli (ex Cha et al. 2016)]|uniref:Uncharacterized protein n=2 Tax=Deinococcus soli (ex Cha et al. 2016) TaxID=1309411 RepID=A0AAE4BL76_9DEIO|nr:hypothetical protein [Deinococcus soli (ex Cha et al. 2016)]MDR6218643.1 hypothetical protein [Deinococcus soli (ex Cha et al. 2016)]MDR6328440.1 hypothetical protein [Deinococcus soli (ex Cha et al. 2016)]MDR6753051.1 hypothetical protein [Deinococcus soli (ex Cha et al. 2016)]